MRTWGNWMGGSLLAALVWAPPASGDVVKPVLAEVSVYKRGVVDIELRASIEALLTGIDGRYRNTQEAPNAEAYDALRVLSAPDLQTAFRPFIPHMLDSLWLKFDGRKAPLAVKSVDIPEPGYTKVPRISVIRLVGEVPLNATEVQWYYPNRFGDNAVRVRQVDEAAEQWHWSEWQWLRKEGPSQVFSLSEVYARRAAWEVIGSYIVIGFEHIAPKGTDHILFIIGIFLFSPRWRPLLSQVTMFTLAHTLTLGLSMAGVVELPARIVEPLIALSIVYVGVENIRARQLQVHRLALVFGFGLLHGLGFAGVLRDFGMPVDAFATALISFNVGVELGQVAVIGAAFLAVGWFARNAAYRRLVVVPGSLVVAATGAWWTVERAMG